MSSRHCRSDRRRPGQAASRRPRLPRPRRLRRPEHSANLSHLTGFAPRFEEAILVVGREGEPLLLAGNECVGVADSAPLPMRVELWQDLSLPGQPRDRSRPLAEIIASEGIGAGSAVGIAGWKTYSERSWLEVPSFLADALRASNEVDQLAAFEYAACHTSEGLRRLLFGLRPGMTEAEAVQLLRWNGAPLSCHLMLSSGPRASLGLLSPTDRVIEHGDTPSLSRSASGARSTAASVSGSRMPASFQPRSTTTWTGW